MPLGEKVVSYFISQSVVLVLSCLSSFFYQSLYFSIDLLLLIGEVQHGVEFADCLKCAVAFL